MIVKVFYILFLGMAVWTAVQIFALTLFRQKIKANLKALLLTSVFLSMISVIVQLINPSLTTFVQPLVFILLFKVFYHFPWKETTIIVTAAYCTSSLSEIGIHYIYSLATKHHVLVKLLNDDFSLVIYIVITLLVLAAFINKARLGFTFVSQTKHPNPKHESVIKFLFWMSLILLAVLSFFSLGVLAQTSYKMFHPIFLLLFAFTLILIRLFYRKEMAE